MRQHTRRRRCGALKSVEWDRVERVARVAQVAVIERSRRSDSAGRRLASDDTKGAAVPQSFYELSTTKLSGEPAELKEYQGKVALVVNTASKCGFTPQYKGLQSLYTELAPRGFVVLGFPSNDFGGQEPGTAEEIKTFCELNYKVTFPMFSKVVTQATEGQSPIYAWLGRAGDLPKWNFSKYLIGRDGKVRGVLPEQGRAGCARNCGRPSSRRCEASQAVRRRHERRSRSRRVPREEQSWPIAGAASGAALRHGDLRRVGRPDEAQADSGAVQPAAQRPAVGQLRGLRRGAPAADRRGVPRARRRRSGAVRRAHGPAVSRLAAFSGSSISPATSNSRRRTRRSRKSSRGSTATTATAATICSISRSPRRCSCR